MNKKKNPIKTILPILAIILFILVGVSVLAYPLVSDYVNSLHQSRVANGYIAGVANLSDEKMQQMIADAQAFNAQLAKSSNQFTLSDAEQAQYMKLLDFSGNEVMGVITIPKINVRLPIYHGTDAAVLQVGAGHVEGTSLPVGGPGTHCAISGHRGLPSSTLFSDLDKMAVGDTFSLQVLNQTLTYEVDQILTVLPDEMDALRIVPGMDYCTLVTCTPYGINTHRLLVRGHRIENPTDGSQLAAVSAGASELSRILILGGATVPVIAVLVVIIVVRYRRAARKIRYLNEHK